MGDTLEDTFYNDELPPVLRVEDVAIYLQLGTNTILRLAKAGIIPGCKIGGQWRFLKTALDDCFNKKSAEETAKRNESPE